jgi:hypothetical protein
MKKLIRHFLAIIFVVSAIGVATPILSTTPAKACAPETLLTFPAWYKGLLDTGTCNLKSPTAAGGLQVYIWKIALNIIDIIMQLVAYCAAGFIIYGGFQFITQTDSADSMAKARTTILNAVIGMVIAISAAAIVNAIGGAF